MFAPPLTVLMALYNGGEYLKESIRSVLGQTCRDFEFLIIDDCSTDNSREIIESFKDQRIRVHSNQTNLGQTKSLNIGLKMALGAYIARIDADDIAFPAWLERQMALAQKNPDCAVVSTRAVIIDQNNRIKKVSKSPASFEDIILRSFTNSPINHVGSLMKRVDVLACGGYGEMYKIAADYDLWGKLARHGYEMISNDEVLVAIRVHESSLSQLERGKCDTGEIVGIMQKNINYFTNLNLGIREVEGVCRLFFHEDSLTEEEFHNAIRQLKQIYECLVPQLKIRQSKRRHWMRRQCYTAYLKRAYFFIKTHDDAAVRRLSLDALKEFGLGTVFSVIFLASLMGGGFLMRRLPDLYTLFLQEQTRFKLKGRIPSHLSDPAGIFV